MKKSDIENLIKGVPDDLIVRKNRDGAYSGTHTLISHKNGRELIGPRQLGYPSCTNKEIEDSCRLFVNSKPLLKDYLNYIEGVNKIYKLAQKLCISAREISDSGIVVNRRDVANLFNQICIILQKDDQNEFYSYYKLYKHHN